MKRLSYSKAAMHWTEALPLGNGRIGAMHFGGVGEDPRKAGLLNRPTVICP
ncbi:glycoside hydrolase N-terminal domain-containing protein [Paenibacillus guangzhouensis]|uniref:glycoside hydrolase N-terminal domain-containing protein n=1 Tax=Paenibacillus guangzhouensis TaxID=1473112 RepID=UPI001D0FDBB6|nr:glycoside hydrolase N-terminal domain-containing protein [Paenibacillus guangzhouensis]